MRKSILTAVLVVLGALSLVAQGGPQLSPLPVPVPLPRGFRPHPQGNRGNRPQTPQTPPQPIVVPAFDATNMGTPLVLDKGWRVGITTDPKAADPDFDDSTWQERDAASTIKEVPDQRPPQQQGQPNSGVHVQVGTNPAEPPGHPVRYAWFRMHIKLAPNHGPLALLMELPVSRSTAWGIGAATDALTMVYANGQLVSPSGPHASDLQHFQQITRLYVLNVPTDQTSLTLAIRTLHFPVGFNAYTNFFANRTLRLGAPGDLQPRVMVWNDGTLFERLPQLVYSVVLFVLAGFLFALYYAQRGHNEYLWLAMHELVQAPIGLVEFAGSTARLDSLWYAALVLQLLLVSAYLYFEFLNSFLGLKHRWYIRGLRYSAPMLGLVGPTLLLVGHSTAIGLMLVGVFICCLLWIVCWLVFVLATLISATVRRNYEAGMLLIPLLLSMLGTVEAAITPAMNELMDRPEQAALTVSAGPIPIHLAAIADFLGVLAIVIIIFMRFLRIQEDQRRAAGELAAARSVQELLIPQDKVATPGFDVDAVYSPAAEVGGDFYHVQTMDGGVLVVIGDVAGKGLQAAMNVSMIMGALRRTVDHSPARVLSSLNRVLTGNESFTTCQAVWFGDDGEVVLANAGHLAPYMNSQEVAAPGGLPLGVIPEVSYDEMRLYLHPGDRLLLYSDGVVEARGPSGELFGFDRVHNMSNQSAFFIADAAKDFGQSDDITVVTVRRTGEAVTASASVKTGLGRLQAVERTAV